MKSSHFLSLPRLSLMASPQMSQPRIKTAQSPSSKWQMRQVE
jgi:hypothetical protein